MSYSLFVFVEGQGLSVSETDLDRASQIVGAFPGVSEALLFTPVAADREHIFSGDGLGPALALQLSFDGLADLEACLTVASPLAEIGALPSLAGGLVSHQAMARRMFPVDEPAFGSGCDGRPCTLMVQYPGPADNLALWLDHYDAMHPPIMRRFPEIRAIETYRPIVWTKTLPWRRASAMQRNKVVFDSPVAVGVALTSPVMAEMRADFHGFPPFSGTPAHHAMETLIVTPSG